MYTSTHTIKTGQTLQVREAVPDDAPKLIAYIEQTCGESDNLSFGPGEFGISEDEEKAILADFLKSDTKLYLIALMDDEIVGSLSFSTGKRIRIAHYGEFGMCVRKRFWKSGIGGILIDALISWAEENATIHKINLSVRCDNFAAIQLYLKKSFQVEGKILDSLRIQSRSFDTYCMGRHMKARA